MAGRPGVRGGASTRGFPPGSAQALVALVLGTIAGVNGLQQGETGWALVLLAIAGLGALQLWRLVRRRRRDGGPAAATAPADTPPAAPPPTAAPPVAAPTGDAPRAQAAGDGPGAPPAT